ncbi:SMI1/KNR4 family protein [Paenibacillus hodogayensis]|uniref:SMI1/KNR4 family protein n=1 Tax=Paenibacillus hodogayensis TaxID=279208 RepID=A0ABV5W0Q0_9BACL
MDKDLLEQLALWHDKNKYQKIVDRILQMPEQDRDYDVNCHLARALNNLGRYEEALQQLLAMKEQGEHDPLWHFRTGYAYYYLSKYENAEAAFEIASKLDPKDRSASMFLNWSRRDAGQRKRRTKKPKAGQTERQTPFEGFDFSSFWDDSDYALKEYTGAPPTDELIASVEEELGYKLPASYMAMIKVHNGGIPIHSCFPTDEATSWASDHIAITGIMGIDRDKRYSLCGDLGGKFMIEEWGYPDIGVVICDCPSGGHDVPGMRPRRGAGSRSRRPGKRLCHYVFGRKFRDLYSRAGE